MKLTDKVIERFRNYLSERGIDFSDDVKDTVISLADAFSDHNVIDFDVDYGKEFRGVNLIFVLNLSTEEEEDKISFFVRREVGKNTIAFFILDSDGVPFYGNIDTAQDFKEHIDSFIDGARKKKWEFENKIKIVNAFKECVKGDKGLWFDDALKVVDKIADAFKLYDIVRASAEYDTGNGDISLAISLKNLSFLVTTEAIGNEGTLNFTAISDGEMLFACSDKIEEFGTHINEFMNKIEKQC